MLRARSRSRPVSWVMRPIHTALLLVATFPATDVPRPPSAPARSPVAAPAYRGFTPGLSYREFLERARPLADSDFVRCQTSPHTAQVMECGVVIRGPNDAARFYLSAHFIEGNADVVAFYDSAGFGDKRGVPLVDRTKKELTRLFGRAHATAALVSVSPPASARKMSASSRDGRCIPHQKAISTQWTT